MKTWLLTLLLCLGLCSGAAAEIYFNTDAPADWQERDILRLTAIDVDRSDAMLLECGGEAMLVDGGSGQFRDRLFETVDSAGITRFKYLFSTHSDNDHIHGLKHLMDTGRYQVDLFTSPNKTSFVDEAGFHQATMRVIQRENIPYHQVKDGECLALGNAQLTVMRCMEIWGSNARSAVLMVQFGSSRVLLTGDIDARTMEHYVKKYGAEYLRAEIMKAPHHGIATIPERFLEAVEPQLIFVPNMVEDTAKFNVYMQETAPEISLMFCGDASIVMETDGVDWYIWQHLNDEN